MFLENPFWGATLKSLETRPRKGDEALCGGFGVFKACRQQAQTTPGQVGKNPGPRA